MLKQKYIFEKRDFYWYLQIRHYIDTKTEVKVETKGDLPDMLTKVYKESEMWDNICVTNTKMYCEKKKKILKANI